MGKTAGRNDETIEIHCIMDQNNFSVFKDIVKKFEPAQKESFKLVYLNSNDLINPDEYIKNNHTYVIDSYNNIPTDNMYFSKRCALYLFLNDFNKTLLWIKSPLLDGFILKTSDTMMKAFLEEVTYEHYLEDEEMYKKSLSEWLTGISPDYEMLTVSFGQMRYIYNKIKKIIQFNRLDEKFNNKNDIKTYNDFVGTLYSIQDIGKQDSLSQIKKAITEIDKLAHKLKKRNVRTYSILLTGETGVGKTFLARCFQDYLLSNSKDDLKSNVNIFNCSHFSRNQIRTELFGALKGSYTGQETTIPGGILESALQILILDEIGDFDLDLQPTLLSYLDDSTVHMQNLSYGIYSPIVLIATTNKNLKDLIAAGKFRKDLFERFDNYIEVPPLRERKEEIKPFIKFILSNIIQRLWEENPFLKHDSEETFISKAAIEYLIRKDYRNGNFRSLQHIVKNSVEECYSKGERIIKIRHIKKAEESWHYS